MTALENEVSGHVVEGTILEDIVRLKRTIMTELRARHWTVEFKSERVVVKAPKPHDWPAMRVATGRGGW